MHERAAAVVRCADNFIDSDNDISIIQHIAITIAITIHIHIVNIHIDIAFAIVERRATVQSGGRGACGLCRALPSASRTDAPLVVVEWSSVIIGVVVITIIGRDDNDGARSLVVIEAAEPTAVARIAASRKQ